MPPRALTWLPLTGLILLTALGFGGLLFGLAGDHSGMSRLAGEVAILGEAPGRENLGPEEIAALPPEAWHAWQGPGFLADRTARAAWVRVTLINPGDVAQIGVLADGERYADLVDLYLSDGYGGWRRLRSGERTPGREKAIWGREVAFPVLVDARATRTVYLRYEDRLALWLDLNWWPEAGAFHAWVLRDLVAESAYFGTLLALLLYNLLLWMRARFPGTGAYLLYLGAFMLYVFVARNEHGVFGVALGSPWMEMIMVFSVALSGIFFAEFARRLLDLPRRLPRVDRVVRGMRPAMGVLAVASLVGTAFGVTGFSYGVVVACAIAHIALFVVAIMVRRADARSARYLLLAFGFLFTGLAPLLAAWVPAVSLEVSGRLAMAGAAMEMLLLSVALSDRFARMQQETIAAQALAVEEAEKRRQIQDAYADELEHEVRERTNELAAANADKDRMIAVLGHDLRSPLTALTLSAEQVAGDARAAALRPNFPGETAQTGRALLLLLEDVVLWARLRAGSAKLAEHAALGVVAPAAELHRAAAAARGIALELAVPAELRVRTDLVLVQTLVRNLVSNAVKAAAGRVTVFAEATEEGRVRVGVRDDGPGLAEDAREKLRRAKAGSVHPFGERTGLGLKLCVEIAAALGTELAADAAAGGGTEMSFTLPRVKT